MKNDLSARCSDCSHKEQGLDHLCVTHTHALCALRDDMMCTLHDRCAADIKVAIKYHGILVSEYGSGLPIVSPALFTSNNILGIAHHEFSKETKSM